MNEGKMNFKKKKKKDEILWMKWGD